MIGHGVLRECLLDRAVEGFLTNWACPYRKVERAKKK